MVPHHISQWYASHVSQFCKLKFLIRQLLTNQSVNLNRASQSIQSIYQLFLIHLVNTMIMTESEWVDLVNVTLIWMSRSIWSIIKSISIGQTIHLVNTKSIWMSQSIHLVNHQVNLNRPNNPSGQHQVNLNEPINPSGQSSSQPEWANQSIWSTISDTSDIVTRSSIHSFTPTPTNQSAKSSTSQAITWWRGKVVDYLSHTADRNIIQNIFIFYFYFFRVNGLLAITYQHLRKYSFPSTV